ncbi:hypothetical protein GF360_00720 [candidate division WWE3 bacterium]|nr:hypothetical protein [candidate division WWE3 bacterium]
MPKQLSAKTQEIKSPLPPTSKEFADTISFKPEKDSPQRHKGSLYGIYSIKDQTAYETDLLTKLITDILKESYYQSENASPIQALENAITEVRGKVLKLKETEGEEMSGDPVTKEKAMLETPESKKEDLKPIFNITVAALWGDVLYLVENGKTGGNTYIVREGNFKQIETVKEGKFAVATGMVNPGDVVVMSTKEFELKFPPKKLLKLNPTKLKELEFNEACVMVKFDLEEGTKKVKESKGLLNLGFGSPEGPKGLRGKREKGALQKPAGAAEAGGRVQNFREFKKSLGFGLDLGLDLGAKTGLRKIFTQAKKELNTPTNPDEAKRLSGEKERSKVESFPKAKRSAATPRRKQFPKRLEASKVEAIKKRRKQIVIGILAAAFVIAIVQTVRAKRQEQVEETENPGGVVEGIAETNPEGTDTDEESQETDASQNPQNSEIFYDIKIVNADANPKYLEITKDKVIVADENGTLYASAVDTPKFEEIAQFEKITDMEISDELVFVATEEKVYVYNTATENTSEISVSTSKAIFPYLQALYQVEENEILKYNLNLPENTETEITETVEILDSSTWAQSEKFRDAKDMAISISIFVLTKDDEIVKYTSGTRGSVETESSLEGATGLKTQWDWENMYVVKGSAFVGGNGSNELLVLDKSGNFAKVIASPVWQDLRDVAISADESEAFVLNGSRVYRVEL